MDIYLRAVGFSYIDKKVMDTLIQTIAENPDKRYILGLDYDKVYIEYYKIFGNSIGLIGRGTLDQNEVVSIDTCEPYVNSDWDTNINSYTIEYIDETPIIIFQDESSENELVFQLQNTIDIMKDEKKFASYGMDIKKQKKVNIAGLSLYGTIVLPVLKDSFEEELQREETKYYKNLVIKSREGDQEAAELLTLYQQQNTDIISERLQQEDFLSVVEGYFVQSDEDELSYSVLGNIEKVNLTINPFTEEEVYKLDMDITGIKVQIYINKFDVTGLPIKGMRFMGMCKLQGKVIIEN